MALNYQWSIIAMSCYPQYEGQTDVVISATWNCYATEVVEGKTVSGTQTGGCMFVVNSLTDFTPYEDLTQEQVLGWCYAANPSMKEAAETNIQNQINDQINPPIVYPPLPWAPPTPPTPTV